MHYTFSQLKRISNHIQFSSTTTSNSEFLEALKMMGSAGLGMAKEKVLAPLRIATLPFQAIKYVGGKVVNSYKNEINDKGVVKGIASNTIKPVKKAWGITKAAANDAWDSIKGVANNIKEHQKEHGIVNGTIGGVRETLNQANELKDRYKDRPLDFINEKAGQWVAQGIKNTVVNKGKQILDDNGITLKNAGKALKSATDAFKNTIANKDENGKPGSILEGLRKGAVAGVKSMDENSTIKKAVTDKIDKVKNTKLGGAVADTLSKSADSIKKNGGELVGKLINSDTGKAITSKLSEFGKTETGQKVVEGAKNLLGDSVDKVLGFVKGKMEK